jgi:hypothetical protein
VVPVSNQFFVVMAAHIYCRQLSEHINWCQHRRWNFLCLASWWGTSIECLCWCNLKSMGAFCCHTFRHNIAHLQKWNSVSVRHKLVKRNQLVDSVVHRIGSNFGNLLRWAHHELSLCKGHRSLYICLYSEWSVVGRRRHKTSPASRLFRIVTQ